ncbi:CBO0543 family protein [Paucisalibacillus sp. EB02]|uniref:CBO0543 family protein n=1 Tax=Paucisalibacillus sp. EB02 TaxID=1347087 RepID=UPI0004B4FA7A|nr:CBO0543 family protein [Paucisalibacillus sp. EB02]
MDPQVFILLLSMVVAAVLLLVFVPKSKVIDANITFLFMQAQSWLYGTLVSQYNLILYPVRILERAYISNFAFEYVVFPTIAVLYNLYFPRAKRLLVKLFYIVLYPTLITLLEVWLEKTTELIVYKHWAWYWSWITMLITLNIALFYYNWFVEKAKKN